MKCFGTALLFIIGLLQSSDAFTNTHYVKGHSTMVHLLEWKWEDIALECERFLGPKGFGGIQISPPNENLAISETNRPWWERYQPISYKLITRSGNETQFADMVKRCNNAGVRIYADAIINHMTGTWNETVGTGGSTADFGNYSYPAVPYDIEDFHWPSCGIESTDYKSNATNVRNCELVGLKDLKHESEHVRQVIVEYLNKLIELGVAGFRIDASKHMNPSDLSVIYDRLNNLSTSHGFPSNARPYIYQEVIDYGGEAVKREEYTSLGAVTEFRFGSELSNVFQGLNNTLQWLVNWGPELDLLPENVSLVFIDNHDTQRGFNTSILTYKKPKLYKAAISFMLAHPYGEPQIISSFNFTDSEAGPPMDEEENIISPEILSNNLCYSNNYICEHRWLAVYEMVAFRNLAEKTDLTNWWDNGNNQISFCRGNIGFVAFNVDTADLNKKLQTCLPAGKYCDVITGGKVDNACQGKTVTVSEDGTADIIIGIDEDEAVLAIHIGAESRLE